MKSDQTFLPLVIERQVQGKVRSEGKAFERLKAELARAFAAQGGVSSVDGGRKRLLLATYQGGNFRATVLRIYPLPQASEGSKSTYAVFVRRL